MNDERYERAKNSVFYYPFGNIPRPGEDYDYRQYVDHFEENLGGPLRMFRAAMLDLVRLICWNEGQEKVARDRIFEKHDEMARLLEDWLKFYEIKDALQEGLE